MPSLRRFYRSIAQQPSSYVLIALSAVLLAYCPRSVLSGGRKVTISRETTYLTEPLRPDGYPDYRAALNAMMGRGVTPESNAAVLLWQAVGISKFRPEDVASYFKLLGVAPPPASGTYLTAVSSYRVKPPPAVLPAGQVVDPNDPDFELNEAMERPWSKAEFPAVAAWLQANGTPLRLAIQASKRPRFFSPAVGPADSGLMGLGVPLLSAERNLSYLISADAMLKVEAGKLDEAWQSATACHRFARLVSQGPALIDVLVGIAIDRGAAAIDCAILGSDRLTAEQARRFGRQFGELPPLAALAERLDAGERFFALNSLVDLARSKTSMMGLSVNITQSMLPRWTPDSHLDWDAALRMANACSDRTVAAATETSPAERSEAAAALRIDSRQLSAEVDAAKLSPLGSTDSIASDLVAKGLLSSTLVGAANTMRREDQNSEIREIYRLAFALAAYRFDHGRYPAALSELVPGYVDVVPKDRPSGLDLHFQSDKSGYVLYGSDYDGNDSPLTDPNVDPPRDHVGIRMPPRASN